MEATDFNAKIKEETLKDLEHAIESGNGDIEDAVQAVLADVADAPKEYYYTRKQFIEFAFNPEFVKLFKNIKVH